MKVIESQREICQVLCPWGKFKAKARESKVASVARGVTKKWSSVIIRFRRRVLYCDIVRTQRKGPDAFIRFRIPVVNDYHADGNKHSRHSLLPLCPFHLHFASFDPLLQLLFLHQLRCFVSHAPVHFLSFRKVKTPCSARPWSFPSYPRLTHWHTNLNFHPFFQLVRTVNCTPFVPRIVLEFYSRESESHSTFLRGRLVSGK